MGHRPGGKAGASAGNAIGFLLLAGAGLTLLAGVVLLPAYAKLADARHAKRCLEADTADLKARIAADDRLIAARDDPVLWQRLAWCQLGLAPEGMVVSTDPDAPPRFPPGAASPPRHPRPEPPDGWMFHAGRKLQRAPLRRGVFLLGAGALFLAIVLFPVTRRSATGRKRKRPAGSTAR